MKKKKTFLRKTGEIYELHILLNTAIDTCQIAGTGNAWLDLGILIEAIGMCMHVNREDGIKKEKIEKMVYEYLEKVKNDYKTGGEITYHAPNCL